MKIKKNIFHWGIILFMFSFYAYTSMGIDYAIKFYYSHKDIWLYLCIIILLVLYFFKQKLKFINYDKFDIGILCMLLVMFIWNNQDFAHGEYRRIIQYVGVILLYFILKQSCDWFGIMLKIWSFVSTFYALGTIWVYLMPSAYKNIIYPMYKNIMAHDLWKYYQNGCISGITAHYTTNGIYLQVGAGVLACMLFLHEKNEKVSWLRYLQFVIVMFALLITGKRAHLFFGVAAFLIVYYIYNVNIKWKRIVKIIFGILVAILILGILSQFVPQTMSAINRMIEGVESGDVSNGRDKMQLIAMAAFLNNPLLGQGWDWFPYNNPLYGGGNFAHNVYKQLLCDVGIVGTIIFITVFAMCIFRSIKLLKDARLQRIILSRKEILFLSIALYHQFFFLLYCTSGNPLYDFNCYYTFFVSVALVEAIKHFSKKRMKRGII